MHFAAYNSRVEAKTGWADISVRAPAERAIAYQRRTVISSEQAIFPGMTRFYLQVAEISLQHHSLNSLSPQTLAKIDQARRIVRGY